MKIEELENPPQWLLDAKTHFADVQIVNGVVYWHGGAWEYGVWQGGVWHNGTWHDGIWENGTWYGGTWYRGTWHEGTWHGGTWINGYRRIVKLVPSSTPPVNG